MASKKTHMERARRAADEVAIQSYQDMPWIIARETFPAELVQAATELLKLVQIESQVRWMHQRRRWAEEEIAAAKGALALYPKPEQEGS